MALSCSGLCGRLSLMRLSGLRTNTITNGFHSLFVSCQSRLPLYRNYSSSKVRRGLGRYVAPMLQKATSKYESFLKRRFPRLVPLNQRLVEGVKQLVRDGSEAKKIRQMMANQRLAFEDLPYRDMLKLIQLRRDLNKNLPLLILALLPFAIYLVFALMHFFPRQALIRQFWTPRQQVEFQRIYHSLRARHYGPVLKGLESSSQQVKGGQLRGRLQDLCAKVQRGENPKVAEILAVRGLFSGPPLGIKRMDVEQMRLLSRLLFLTPRLPGFLIGWRLNSHALQLLQLDRALIRLDPYHLSESELQQACFMRGIDLNCLSTDQCRDWLTQWLRMSSSLKDSELSLLLHSIVFLSANCPGAPSRH